MGGKRLHWHCRIFFYFYYVSPIRKQTYFLRGWDTKRQCCGSTSTSTFWCGSGYPLPGKVDNWPNIEKFQFFLFFSVKDIIHETIFVFPFMILLFMCIKKKWFRKKKYGLLIIFAYFYASLSRLFFYPDQDPRFLKWIRLHVSWSGSGSGQLKWIPSGICKKNLMEHFWERELPLFRKFI